MTVNPENFPAEVLDSVRAVLWNRQVRGGKATKVPYNPHFPERKAKVDDPATWASMREAIAAYEDGKADGVGLVLGDGLIGVDLDHCRDAETRMFSDDARAIIDEINSYTEISPSGTGLHVLLRGVLPPGGRRKGLVEMYADARYFTVTGQHVPGTPTTIEERRVQLAALHARIFGSAPDSHGNGHRPTPASMHDDDASLIAKAKGASNGVKFSALWAGDASGYASPSEADQALCGLLAFWCSADAGRMDRLFRQSGLFRSKWDHRRGALTYGERTIDRAIASCPTTYTGRVTRASKAASVIGPPNTVALLSPATSVSHLAIQAVLTEVAVLEERCANLTPRIVDACAERAAYRELAQAALTKLAELTRRVEHLMVLVREQRGELRRYTAAACRPDRGRAT